MSLLILSLNAWLPITREVLRETTIGQGIARYLRIGRIYDDLNQRIQISITEKQTASTAPNQMT